MANSQEYGLFQLIDLGILPGAATAASVDSGLLQSGIVISQAQHNADIDAAVRLFATDTTEYQLKVDQTGGTRSQPLDENGRAIPVKPGPSYTAAFPIQGSGSAIGFNYVTSKQMTVRDMARAVSGLFRGDYTWVVDHILGALFANSSYTFTDPRAGALTIRGLANSDTVTYYDTTTGANATDTHYLGQAGAIADGAATNPYPVIAAKLTSRPDNSGEVVAFISTSLVATTQALAEFNSALVDPQIQLGANTDRLVGTLNLTLPLGARVLGKTDSGVWVVEWPKIPAGYIVAITTQGPRPLARRQFPQADLQGFRPAGQRQDFPYFEDQWQRWEGYGAFNRVGAVVMEIADASYDVPTGYSVPMA